VWLPSINASLLDPDVFYRRGITPHAIRDIATGGRFESAEDLAKARQTNRGNLVFVEFLRDDDPSTRELLTRALLFPETAIASDGSSPCGLASRTKAIDGRA
jgi:hypothetical protein